MRVTFSAKVVCSTDSYVANLYWSITCLDIATGTLLLRSNMKHVIVSLLVVSSTAWTPLAPRRRAVMPLSASSGSSDSSVKRQAPLQRRQLLSAAAAAMAIFTTSRSAQALDLLNVSAMAEATGEAVCLALPFVHFWSCLYLDNSGIKYRAIVAECNTTAHYSDVIRSYAPLRSSHSLVSCMMKVVLLAECMNC